MRPRLKTKLPGVSLATLLAAAVWLAPLTANAAIYNLKVDGLACPFCSYGIEKQLQKLSGVSAVKTDIKSGTVRVETGGNAKLNDAQLRDAVDRAGFTLRGIQ